MSAAITHCAKEGGMDTRTSYCEETAKRSDGKLVCPPFTVCVVFSTSRNVDFN